MNTISIRDFRSNMASSLDRVDAGEKILIRRHNKIYTIITVDDDDLTITPRLKKKIEQAREAFKRGETVTCHNTEEINAFLDSL